MISLNEAAFMKRKISKDRNEDRLFSLKKLNENQVFFWLVLLFIAAVMFIFNRCTSFTADDYSYMNSFASAFMARPSIST